MLSNNYKKFSTPITMRNCHLSFFWISLLLVFLRRRIFFHGSLQVLSEKPDRFSMVSERSAA